MFTIAEVMDDIENGTFKAATDEREEVIRVMNKEIYEETNPTTKLTLFQNFMDYDSEYKRYLGRYILTLTCRHFALDLEASNKERLLAEKEAEAQRLQNKTRPLEEQQDGNKDMK